MHRGFAIGISIIVVVLVACVGLFLFWMSEHTDSQYDIIAERWTGGGKFVDYANDTGVKSAQDVKYYVDKSAKEVEILYGYITLDFTFKQMNSEEWIEKLAYIGITYDIKPNTRDDFRLYWCGEEMPRCADKPSVG